MTTTLMSCLACCSIGVAIIFHVLHRFWKQHRPTKTTKQSTHSMHTISYGWLLWIFPSIAFSSLWITLIISVHYNYNGVTRIICRGRYFTGNFFPSISACIGDYYPQRALWRGAIALHNWVGLCGIVVTYYHYKECLAGTAQCTNLVRAGCCVVENIGLLVLSMVSSTEHGRLHEIGFIVYVVGHATSMFLTILLTKYHIALEQNNTNKTNTRQQLKYSIKALKYRQVVALVNMVSLFLAAYFFIASEKGRCSTYGWYSMFALCEWVYVWSGIAFHVVEQVDLYYVEINWSAAAVFDEKSSLVDKKE
jgi:hypothetical protein